ncbi:CoA pyrophosphatase [Halopseudomonas laoshanensis]|jgi:8-oxo-dGTP pyrophosphatase MutT (NUDIX family)|uniref:CoA pyrophosphatase n=2 Tax=Halopseudomonas TaxID=2901189 RepID=A0A7V7GRW4_9GAMM|nr:MULTISPECIES: CoA pyrophosphatase [Halopseudomonas]MBQ0742194.1 CoA pyrophosphatase [Pseudomonas sp.]WOD10580.1 CoA pyrophosphatase [Pseudomonas sp. NyZ704]KAA0693233.1 CoA pyrophosphatase [Halopseudomonas laoshanensis]MBQ0778791.1 CoA pyrophosphatase [Pseudomonas sp.]PCC97967.1 coenzyme A pyrophosphatase [Halopseudomonas pelagia]
MLDKMRMRVGEYRPRQIETLGMPEAGVLIPVTCVHDRPEIILTLRSQRMTTHSGEVAFPGGRRDPGDVDLRYTALRETHEEIGLEPDRVEVIGPMGSLVSRYGIKVTPYVGIVPDVFDIVPSSAEIDAVFRVPVAFFMEDRREMTHRIDYEGRSWYVPSYRYEGHKIWGLTALMLVEFMNVAFDADIPLHTPYDEDRKQERR